jgi:hypothetical protein
MPNTLIEGFVPPLGVNIELNVPTKKELPTESRWR